MKLQLTADLRLEFQGLAMAHETIIRPLPDADAMGLAGNPEFYRHD